MSKNYDYYLDMYPEGDVKTYWDDTVKRPYENKETLLINPIQTKQLRSQNEPMSLTKWENADEIQQETKQYPSPFESHIRENYSNFKMPDLLNQTVDRFGAKEILQPPQAEKDEAKKNLNEILDRQYPKTKTTSLNEMREQTNSANSRSLDAVIGQNIIGSVADARLNSAFDKIEKNKDVIKQVGKEFGVPPEILGAIILKEQYTQSAPDWLIVMAASLGYSGGSTGLGAVQSGTAKSAWQYYREKTGEGIGRTDAQLMRSKNADVLRKLKDDDEFAIRTIAAVLRYEAQKFGFDGSLEYVYEPMWRNILKKYNGSGAYADKTLEYLPDMKTLLN